MEKRLLILGSLDEFILLVKMAKQRGMYTIVCDGYENGPAKREADKAYNIPVTEIDRIADLCREEGVTGIITSFSDLLFECMVKIAAKAGLKCYLTPEQLPCYRDKTVMKEMFRRLEIPSPKYACLERDFTDDKLAGFRFPVVVKPVDKYGSRGIFVLYDAETIRQRFDEICATSEIKRIIVEEYNDGFEFNLMSWVLDGKVHIISIADREKSPVGRESIPISSRNVYPSRLYDSVAGQAQEILQRVVDETGQRSGALSMQFFWKPGEPVSVCEITGRFLGYEHELIELSSGFSLERLLLDYISDEAALRRSLLAHDPRMKRCSAVLYFHGKEGMTVAHQQAALAVGQRPEVVFSQYFYCDGQRIIPHSNPYAARFYVAGDSREQVDRTTQAIFSAMSITDPQGREVLYHNQMTDYGV